MRSLREIYFDDDASSAEREHAWRATKDELEKNQLAKVSFDFHESIMVDKPAPPVQHGRDLYRRGRNRFGRWVEVLLGPANNPKTALEETWE